MTTHPGSGRESSRRMTLWLLATGAMSAWGAVAAVRQLPWQSLLAVFLAAGLLAASLSLSNEAVSSDRVDLWRAGTVGAVTGFLVVVAVGLAGSVGGPGVAVLGVVLLARPGLAARVRATLRRTRPGSTAHPDGSRRPVDGRDAGRVDRRDDAWERTVPGSLATEPEPRPVTAYADEPLDTAPDWSPSLSVPSHLSDHDLCLAWESSGLALRRCTTTSERLELVRVRQACLDELERRQPEALRAWVLAGADPDSSPARYLTG